MESYKSHTRLDYRVSSVNINLENPVQVFSQVNHDTATQARSCPSIAGVASNGRGPQRNSVLVGKLDNFLQFRNRPWVHHCGGYKVVLLHNRIRIMRLRWLVVGTIRQLFL